MANLPEDIMLSCILTRLPVKTILRFKSVCKAWLHLLSTPEFLKLHRAHFSSDPRNQSLILYSYPTSTIRVLIMNNTINNNNSINDHQSKQQLAAALFVDHPYGGPDSYGYGVEIVGCCNGLVCMVCPERGCVLWNPAMRVSKFVALPEFDYFAARKPIMLESLGFGYDSEGDDFKVVKIFCDGMYSSVAEVYSDRSCSWTTIEIRDFQFQVAQTKCDLIVKGNPYWRGWIYNCEERSWSDLALVCFEATKLVFKTVPLPSFFHSLDVECVLVDLKGSPGVLVSEHFVDDIGTPHLSIDAWVFDEICWRKAHGFGPVEANVRRFLQCLGNGNIVGDRWDGELFVLDPNNNGAGGCVNVVDSAQEYCCDHNKVYGYTECLTQIN